MKNETYIDGFDLTQYLTNGVQNIIKDAIKATIKDPKESAFMMRYALASRQAAKKRAAAEEDGEHIPPFLIASITSSCNLHCAGCYARHNHACSDEKAVSQLTDNEWLDIFRQAQDLGIGFILLAGGEPLIRKDVVKAAATIPDILFPIFTNGTLIDDDYISLFDRHRNLIPVFSIEGHRSKTDERRGDGVYNRLILAMDRMQKKHLIFGSSVTVTTANMHEVVSSLFLNELQAKGCKIVFYIEYVPVSNKSQELALTDADRAFMSNRIMALRDQYPEMLFITFPGDEKSSGGCLAAGRGFFHINSHGGAEPCPFSPYSDINVKDTSLKGALHSKLFLTLQSENLLSGEHIGGCVLFEQQKQVEEILKRDNKA